MNWCRIITLCFRHWKLCFGLLLGVCCILFLIWAYCRLRGQRPPWVNAEGRHLFEYFLHLFLVRHPASAAYLGTRHTPTSTRRHEVSSFKSKGEQECQRVLETYFQKPFRTVRPEFMKNPVTHENLELDLYNEELQLAVEFNGKQHYEYVPFMHSSRHAFRNQQYRDLIKKDLCQRNGIHLISVDYRCPNIEHFLHQELALFMSSKHNTSDST